MNSENAPKVFFSNDQMNDQIFLETLCSRVSRFHSVLGLYQTVRVIWK